MKNKRQKNKAPIKTKDPLKTGAFIVGVALLIVMIFWLNKLIATKNTKHEIFYENLAEPIVYQDGTPLNAQIAQIQANPKGFEGKKVIIKGYYTGNAPIPGVCEDGSGIITKKTNDVTINDDTGCIKYSGDIYFGYKEVDKLTPDDINSWGKKIVVLGKVELINGKPVLISPN